MGKELREMYSHESLEELVGWVITGDFIRGHRLRREDYDSHETYWRAHNRQKDGEIVRELLDNGTRTQPVTMWTFMAVIKLFERGLIKSPHTMQQIVHFLEDSYLGAHSNIGMFCKEAEKKYVAPHPFMVELHDRYSDYIDWMEFAETYEETHWFVDLNSTSNLPNGNVYVFKIPEDMK